jgi:hypothetical protein
MDPSMRYWLLLAAFLLPASHLSGQTAESRRPFSLLISSQTAIGLAWGMDGATDIGLVANATAVDDENFQTSWMSIQPTVKHYLAEAERWSPYALLGVGWTWRSTEYETLAFHEESARGITIDVGVGLEWFALERLSVGAHAGLGGSYEDIREVREIQIDPSQSQVQRSEHTRRYFSLFNSGVRASLYF